MSQVLTDGNDYLNSTTDAVVYGLDGNDRIQATQNGLNDIYGGEGDDFIGLGNNGPLLVGYGGAGNDAIHGGTVLDQLYGDDGNDLLVGGEFTYSQASLGIIDQFDSATGDDSLYGGNGIDALYGLDGNDTLYGGDGNDTGTITVKNHQASDTFYTNIKAGLYGGAGNDYLDGGNGNDSLDGGAGNDQLVGGNGNDVLIGGTGTDEMIGGVGNDIYEVDNIGDVCKEADGADGIDTVFAYVNYTLGNALDNLIMSFGTQTYGYGNGADNTIIGNAQNNVIEGKAGYDVLTGGAGSDLFVINPNWSVDVITDFTPGAGTQDAVIFSKAIFSTYAQVMGNSAQVGADVYIGDGFGDTVVLQNVTLAQLHPDDFGFF